MSLRDHRSGKINIGIADVASVQRKFKFRRAATILKGVKIFFRKTEENGLCSSIMIRWRRIVNLKKPRPLRVRLFLLVRLNFQERS